MAHQQQQQQGAGRHAPNGRVYQQPLQQNQQQQPQLRQQQAGPQAHPPAGVRFCVASDLHLEMRPLTVNNVVAPQLQNGGCDVLVLAGDIGSLYDQAVGSLHAFLHEASQKFPHVLMVAGNHEYYSPGASIDQVSQCQRA